jgi:hypothetical protein
MSASFLTHFKTHRGTKTVSEFAFIHADAVVHNSDSPLGDVDVDNKPGLKLVPPLNSGVYSVERVLKDFGEYVEVTRVTLENVRHDPLRGLFE